MGSTKHASRESWLEIKSRTSSTGHTKCVGVLNATQGTTQSVRGVYRPNSKGHTKRVGVHHPKPRNQTKGVAVLDPDLENHSKRAPVTQRWGGCMSVATSLCSHPISDMAVCALQPGWGSRLFSSALSPRMCDINGWTSAGSPLTLYHGPRMKWPTVLEETGRCLPLHASRIGGSSLPLAKIARHGWSPEYSALRGRARPHRQVGPGLPIRASAFVSPCCRRELPDGCHLRRRGGCLGGVWAYMGRSGKPRPPVDPPAAAMVGPYQWAHVRGASLGADLQRAHRPGDPPQRHRCRDATLDAMPVPGQGASVVRGFGMYARDMLHGWLGIWSVCCTGYGMGELNATCCIEGPRQFCAPKSRPK